VNNDDNISIYAKTIVFDDMLFHKETKTNAKLTETVEKKKKQKKKSKERIQIT